MYCNELVPCKSVVQAKQHNITREKPWENTVDAESEANGILFQTLAHICS